MPHYHVPHQLNRLKSSSTLPIPQAVSAVDGCRDARDLNKDGIQCPMAKLMEKWYVGGHPERSFARYTLSLKTCFCVLVSNSKGQYQWKGFWDPLVLNAFLTKMG